MTFKHTMIYKEIKIYQQMLINIISQHNMVNKYKMTYREISILPQIHKKEIIQLTAMIT